MAFDPQTVCQIAMHEEESVKLLEVLKGLTPEINEVHVPTFLDEFIVGILGNIKLLAKDRNAAIFIKWIMSQPAFARQCDWIIDNYVLDHIVELSQDKFGSCVVETALYCASPIYLKKIFNEVLEGYKERPYIPSDTPGTPRTALEVMMFDQYGNYVVQEMLIVAREVQAGVIPGNPKWFHAIWATAKKNSRHLSRFKYGRKILEDIQLRH